jgi:hypothetical protein
VCRTARQQRSTPLAMIRELGAFWRAGLLPSTACKASQARALIGATTSRLVGFWLIQACSGATVPFPSFVRPVGRHSLNSTVAVLRAHRAAANVTKSRFVASRTFPALGTNTSQNVVIPLPAPRGRRWGSGHRGGALDIEKLLTPPLFVVGFAAAPQAEQSFRD